MKSTIVTNMRIISLAVVSVFASAGCSTVQNILPGQSEPAIGQAQGKQLRDSTDRVGRHIYASAGLGVSRMNPDASEVPAFTVNDRVERGGQATIGVDLSRQMAVELHSADLGSAGFDPGGRINYHIAGASALVYAGKNRHNFKRRGLSGYGRVGLGYLENTPVGNVPFVKDNATHVLFGAGVEYMTRLGLGLRAEGIAFEEDAQYAQLGVIYRTGRRPEAEIVEIAEEPVIIPEPVAAVPQPEPVPYNTCDHLSGVLEGVNFHTDSAQLTDTATQILDQVAFSLQDCSTTPVSISAHTDSVGAESYNQGLSERRASSVVDYLSNRGIDGSRLSSTAYGETAPIDTNDTAEGRQRNRRVELIAH